MADVLDAVVEEITVNQDDESQIAADLKELGIEPPPVEKPAAEVPHDEDDTDHPDDVNKTDEERAAIRERRRIERQEKKQRLKEREESYRREIDGLRKQLDEVNTWKNTVEKRNVQSGVAQIDKGIQDANEALELAKQAIAQATQDQNGQALVDAQELYYAARKRGEDLSRAKQVIMQRLQQRPQQQQNLPDQQVVSQFREWHKDKSWYDVRGQDQDSQIVQAIERNFAAEGWDPRTREYWQELDTRIKKYLPHRFAVSYTGSNTTSPGGAPRPPTGSSVSTSQPSPQGFRLSPDRVRAIKEAGAWDDPVKRKEMIKAYADYDKQSGRN